VDVALSAPYDLSREPSRDQLAELLGDRALGLLPDVRQAVATKLVP
jgi:hypothetical protein